jgi:late competence protein required for DNA uptake (superfamily II DNA/RNA helicase)
MFKCERCGSGYSASHLGVEHCPRCMLLDRVQAPLTFKVFKLPESRPATAPQQPMREEQVRESL